MVAYNVTMISVYKALADPVRQQLLDALHERNGQTLTELRERLSISRQAVMKHIAILEAASVVSTSRWGRYKVHYLNRLPLRNLGDRWLDNRSSGTPTDAITTKPDFVYAIIMKASPQQVWQALTDPALTRQYWYDAAIESDWHVGSQVRLLREDGSFVGGKLLEYKKPLRLRYEFSRSGEPTRARPIEVTFDLILMGQETKLVITSRNLLEIDLNDNPHVLYGLNNGWPVFMSSLKTLLETGQPLHLEGG
jgi:uncharacterized protein YndB with AHSA1/START domain/DNA-binding transcriptional ArsR family regulator